MKMTLIPYGRIALVLEPLLAHLEDAVERTDGRYCMDDVLQEIFNGRYLVWVLRDGTIKGVVVTSEAHYPRMKLLAIQYMGAEVGTLEKSEALIIETLESFAKDAGCAGMEWAGRTGWMPWAKKYGYSTKGMYQKLFEV